jgi:HJR/Mrr/RecB family endonuclease
MEVLLIIPLLLLIAWWVRNAEKQDKRNKLTQEQYTNRQLEEYVKNISAVCIRNTEPHIHTLWVKWKQLSFKDDYGKFIDTSWKRELHYFVETVIVPMAYIQPGREDGDKEFMADLVECDIRAYNTERELSGFPNSDPLGAYAPSMSGQEFEHLVENVLLSIGADVTRTPKSGDQGVDLMVRFKGLKLAIQCKRSAASVGNKAVQEIVSGKLFYKADHALVVSDSRFTKSARQLASSLDVHLVRHLGLPQKVRELVSNAGI